MKTKTILLLSFIASFCITIVGAGMKILHAAGADTSLALGFILSSVFILVALYEVITSNRINRTEKALWSIGLLFMGGIVGLVYLLAERRRIVESAHV